MLSKSEKKYLLRPGQFNQNYQYVLKHRIEKKIKALLNDLEWFINSDNYLKDYLKDIFKNFNMRVEKGLKDPLFPIDYDCK